MTHTVAIYGANDDLVEIEGDIDGADEYMCPSGHASFTMVSPDGGTAVVYADFRDNGVWSVALSRYEEDYAIPNWNARIISDDTNCTYSATLLVDVPEGTTITKNY
jgi:hypothetical protein